MTVESMGLALAVECAIWDTKSGERKSEEEVWRTGVGLGKHEGSKWEVLLVEIKDRWYRKSTIKYSTCSLRPVAKA